MVKSSLIYKEESYKIVGACFEVYNNMGSGFLENVYQECLSFELSKQEIDFVEQKRIKIFYKGNELTQNYIADFECFGKIIVEIKAVSKLSDEHRSQVINYLHATNYKLALLVNFGSHSKLEYERFVNKEGE